MGEAQTAVAEDARALYWNPAGLARIDKRAASFSHVSHIDSSFYEYGSYGQSLREWGVVGVGFQYFSAGAVNRTDITGSDAGQFTPYDLAVALAYASSLDRLGLGEGFSVGLSGKYIESRLLQSARTAAVDLGLLSPSMVGERLRLAFTLQNLGGTLKFEQQAADLPMVIKTGSSFKITDRWLTALDVGFPRDDDPFVALGTEYRLAVQDAWTLAARTGFNSRTIDDVDGVTGLSFGIGFSLRRLELDYAFLPFGGVGQSHRVSVSARF